MARQNINVGTGPNSLDGDVLRNAFIKANQNFIELYQVNQAVPITVYELASDMLVNGTHTGITVSYDSENQTISLTGFSGDYNDLINKPFINTEAGSAATVFTPGELSFDGSSSSAVFNPNLINLDGGGA